VADHTIDYNKSKAAETLSRKAIRAFVSDGVGPTKLFLLVRAPATFNLPLHFLPKCDFRYSQKVGCPYQILFCAVLEPGRGEVEATLPVVGMLLQFSPLGLFGEVRGLSKGFIDSRYLFLIIFREIQGGARVGLNRRLFEGILHFGSTIVENLELISDCLCVHSYDGRAAWRCMGCCGQQDQSDHIEMYL
ncbi:hypothetical protein IFM89_017638, partial [Coptis chinensis]